MNSLMKTILLSSWIFEVFAYHTLTHVGAPDGMEGTPRDVIELLKMNEAAHTYDDPIPIKQTTCNVSRDVRSSEVILEMNIVL